MESSAARPPQRSEAEGRVFEAGGPEVLQYVTMLRRVAAIEGRPLPILPVPLLSPRLSSLWLTLVTDVDTATGRALVGSMTNEVIVWDNSIRDLITFEPGAIGSGPLPVGRALSQRHELCHALAVPVLTGAGAFGLFYGAANSPAHPRT